MGKSYVFNVVHPGEFRAGINGYTDKVTITVDSGDPGGEAGEFEAFMCDSLEMWYDGASVWQEATNG